MLLRGGARHSLCPFALAACLGWCLLFAAPWRPQVRPAFVGAHKRLGQPKPKHFRVVRCAEGEAPAADGEASGAKGEASGLLEPLKLASVGMGLLKPVFAAEAQLQAGGYDREATRAALKEEAKSAPVVVYTYSLSPFCTEATKLLDSLGAEYKEVVLAPEWFLMLGEGAAKRAELAKLFGRSSMPHIFIGGRSIGGLTEGEPGLLPLYEAGELEATLKQVGALPAEDTPFGFFLYSGDKPKVKCYGSDFCEPAD